MGHKETYQVIGVVGNAKSRTLGEGTRPILYRSLDQSIADDPSMMGYTLIVHTRNNLVVISEALRHEVYELDPTMAIYNVETMDEHVASGLRTAARGGHALWGVRRNRVAAGYGGPVRRHELRSDPAYTRDRHPDGYGRTAGSRIAACFAPGYDADVRSAGARLARRMDAGEASFRSSLRHLTARRTHVYVGADRAHSGCACCRLDPCPARLFNQPDPGIAGRMKAQVARTSAAPEVSVRVSIQ